MLDLAKDWTYLSREKENGSKTVRQRGVRGRIASFPNSLWQGRKHEFLIGHMIPKIFNCLPETIPKRDSHTDRSGECNTEVRVERSGQQRAQVGTRCHQVKELYHEDTLRVSLRIHTCALWASGKPDFLSRLVICGASVVASDGIQIRDPYPFYLNRETQKGERNVLEGDCCFSEKDELKNILFSTLFGLFIPQTKQW